MGGRRLPDPGQCQKRESRRLQYKRNLKFNGVMTRLGVINHGGLPSGSHGVVTNGEIRDDAMILHTCTVLATAEDKLLILGNSSAETPGANF